MQNDTYYGAPSDSDVRLIRERLRDLYDPEDFVTIMNIDTKSVTYQFASPQDVETYSSGPGDKNTVQKRPPQRITLQPGDTKLVPAYEADQMIEATIKQIAVRKVQDKVDAGTMSDHVATADWTDPGFQNSMIKQIFLGKKDILSQYNTPESPIEKDLEFDVKPQVGRPRKEV